ncbi:MAG: alpha/beta hydrolase [Sphingomonas sp.]|nr:alpha/beta hydrolase [Sphingomonas sp.]
MTEILYRSERLEVRRVAAGDGRSQVITFDSYHEPPGMDRPGFGEAFFRGEGITAVHVMSYGNNWFQYIEIQELLRVLRKACAHAERLLTYGSSMGGYAALRFAGAVGAHAALALSPQYSLDPRKVPFETRWASDRRRIRFLKAVDGAPIQRGPRMIIAYDGALDADRLHAELLMADTPMTAIALPHSGHPVGGFLNDIRLLRPLVLSALDGSFDPTRFHRAAHARRTLSAHWLAHLADRQPPWRIACAIALAQRAVELAPDHPSLHDVLARRLAAAGQYAEAIAVHHRAIAIEPIADYLWGLSKTLFAAGDIAGALEIAQRIQALTPYGAGYHAWAARLREAQGDLPGQLADLRRAIRYDRTNRGYRWQLLRLIWRRWLARLSGRI